MSRSRPTPEQRAAKKAEQAARNRERQRQEEIAKARRRREFIASWRAKIDAKHNHQPQEPR